MVGGLAVGVAGWIVRWEGSLQKPEEAVVARVNGEPLFADDYRHWVNRQNTAHLSPEVNVERLARHQALAQRAKAEGIADDAAYRAALRSLQVSFLRERRLMTKWAQLQITDADVEAAYEAQREEQFSRPPRYDVAVLWLDHRGRDNLKATYRQRLETVREQITNDTVPLDSGFGNHALNATEHRASRFQGGKLGWLEDREYPDAIRNEALAIARDLPEGALSAVRVSADGVFLLRLIQKQEAAYQSLDTVRRQIEAELLAERRAQLEADFEAEALAATTLSLFPENLPPILPDEPKRLAQNLR